MRALHPARQLVWHLRARQSLPAPAILTSAEAALFARMPPADQLEGLAVSRTLVAWGYAADRDLLAAGAIHDVGKSLAPPSSLYRTLMTLLGALTPWLVPALARRFSTIRLLDQHAGTGASMAAEAGVASEVVRLIAEHHVTTAEPRLVALQMADALH